MDPVVDSCSQNQQNSLKMISMDILTMNHDRFGLLGRKNWWSLIWIKNHKGSNLFVNEIELLFAYYVQQPLLANSVPWISLYRVFLVNFEQLHEKNAK